MAVLYVTAESGNLEALEKVYDWAKEKLKQSR
jgi:hypothetical protein